MSDIPSEYYDHEKITERVAKGAHRGVIGGKWDEIGQLQIEFLKSNGLRPENTLLDIGCGCLRLGVHAVSYLNSGNYWGTDLNESLLVAGYKEEIEPAGLEAKLSRAQLITDKEFTFAGLPHSFDFALAQSVFTHLPVEHMRLCLTNLANHLDGPCTFFLTVFIAPPEETGGAYTQITGNATTYPDRDPYNLTIEDLASAAQGLPWEVEYIGDWNHPRNQKIAAFRKT
jgi:2-polyprenyl-3-methyl-5-hydroxy-6-metoxy-1,4-benzoquinol methylase